MSNRPENDREQEYWNAEYKRAYEATGYNSAIHYNFDERDSYASKEANERLKNARRFGFPEGF